MTANLLTRQAPTIFFVLRYFQKPAEYPSPCQPGARTVGVGRARGQFGCDFSDGDGQVRG